jgi:uncharacterized damage-inducible protein DinB
MTDTELKADLHRYLQDAREALLWKLDGLSEYDMRRPLVPTGTSLLGLVKHVTGVELAYFGSVFGRPSADPLPWDESDPMTDMFAAADHALVRLATETARHAGHADIVRELIDGAAGWTSAKSSLPDADQPWWQTHHDRVATAAR